MREYINIVETASAMGKPMTVIAYHGAHTQFDSFDSEQSSEFSGVQRLGVWFTDSFEAAKRFALDGNHADHFGHEEAWVIEARLTFRKALVVNGWQEGLHGAAGAILEPYDYRQYERSFEAFRARLIEEGFDGIVIENSSTDNAGHRTDYVVLDHSAISITGKEQINEPYHWGDDE